LKSKDQLQNTFSKLEKLINQHAFLEIMKLSIIFTGKNDQDIENSARDLESKVKDLKVDITRFQNWQAQFAPSPYAFFEGQKKVREYGKEAVSKLIEDITQQRQY